MITNSIQLNVFLEVIMFLVDFEEIRANRQGLLAKATLCLLLIFATSNIVGPLISPTGNRVGFDLISLHGKISPTSNRVGPLVSPTSDGSGLLLISLLFLLLDSVDENSPHPVVRKPKSVALLSQIIPPLILQRFLILHRFILLFLLLYSLYSLRTCNYGVLNGNAISDEVKGLDV